MLTGPLTRVRAAAIADVVLERWLRSSTRCPVDIDIDLLVRQISDALKWERERRACELRVELLRGRMLRLLGEL